MAANDQYLSGQAPFGLSDSIAHTGAPGSAGAMASEAGEGPALASVTVTDPFSSSQSPQPVVSVAAGDTATGGQLVEGISGAGQAQTTDSGAGHGHVQMAHPNSTAGRQP